jgi:hypothetical protein
MTALLLAPFAIVAGYVIAIFTWPRLRQAMLGIETEIADLRAKARALETELRG